MYKPIQSVLAQQNHTLLLHYANGEQRELDFKPFLGLAVYKHLHDWQQFQRVRPVFDTVEWENDIDIDPEVLYAHSYAVFSDAS